MALIFSSVSSNESMVCNRMDVFNVSCKPGSSCKQALLCRTEVWCISLHAPWPSGFEGANSNLTSFFGCCCDGCFSVCPALKKRAAKPSCKGTCNERPTNSYNTHRLTWAGKCTTYSLHSTHHGTLSALAQWQSRCCCTTCNLPCQLPQLLLLLLLLTHCTIHSCCNCLLDTGLR